MHLFVCSLKIVGIPQTVVIEGHLLERSKLTAVIRTAIKNRGNLQNKGGGVLNDCVKDKALVLDGKVHGRYTFVGESDALSKPEDKACTLLMDAFKTCSLELFFVRRFLCFSCYVA